MSKAVIVFLLSIFSLFIITKSVSAANVVSYAGSIMSPAAGSTFQTDDYINIAWTVDAPADFVESVSIDYYTESGSHLKGIMSCSKSTCPANNQYTWLIPSQDSFLGNGYVSIDLVVIDRASDSYGNVRLKSSLVNIRQRGSVKFTDPIQNSVYKFGSAVKVLFDCENPFRDSSIKVSSDNMNGGLYSVPGADTAMNYPVKFDLYKGSGLVKENIYVSGSNYFWLNDITLPAGDDYKFKLTFGQLEAFSSVFKIEALAPMSFSVKSPKANEVVSDKNSYTITWDYVGEKKDFVSLWLDLGVIDDTKHLVYPITPMIERGGNPYTRNTGNYKFNFFIPSLVPQTFLNPKTWEIAYTINALDGNIMMGNFSDDSIDRGKYRVFAHLYNSVDVNTANVLSDYFAIGPVSASPVKVQSDPVSTKSDSPTKEVSNDQSVINKSADKTKDRVVEVARIIYLSGDNLNDYLKYSGHKKNVKDQSYAYKKYSTPLFGKLKLSQGQKYAINNFIVYSNGLTAKLTAKDRVVLLNRYKAKYKSLPTTAADWEKLLRLI